MDDIDYLVDLQVHVIRRERASSVAEKSSWPRDANGSPKGNSSLEVLRLMVSDDHLKGQLYKWKKLQLEFNLHIFPCRCLSSDVRL